MIKSTTHVCLYLGLHSPTYWWPPWCALPNLRVKLLSQLHKSIPTVCIGLAVEGLAGDIGGVYEVVGDMYSAGWLRTRIVLITGWREGVSWERAFELTCRSVRFSATCLGFPYQVQEGWVVNGEHFPKTHKQLTTNIIRAVVTFVEESERGIRIFLSPVFDRELFLRHTLRTLWFRFHGSDMSEPKHPSQFPSWSSYQMTMLASLRLYEFD